MRLRRIVRPRRRREKEMIRWKGKAVCRGIVCGPAAVLKRDERVKRQKTADPAAEISRLESALEEAKGQLEKLYKRAAAEVGEDSAAIFEVHRMMLEDEDYLDAVRSLIAGESVNAEYAVSVTGDNFSEMFAGMEDEYMKARAADVRDVSVRLVRCLRGEEEPDFSSLPPSVVFADDLTPSETVRLDKSRILAFVTVHGSVNSHTAILARTMSIPAVVGVPVDFEKLKNGVSVVVDAFSGEVIADPDGETLAAAEKRMAEERENAELLQSLKGKENITKDGHRVELFANVGSVSDVGYALENDAGGIGLFRSEFLYLGRNDYPGEEEQYQAYRQVLQIMAGKKVVIRTLDIGADKQAAYFGLEKEENPAMGCRAIRLCLTRPKIFKTQLRALLRAARYGNLSVMYPMITSGEEIKRIYALVAEAEAELKSEGIPYKIPEQGIMIETPAAAVISDLLAGSVDFFSVGTNDLTQYMLAIDRQNEKLDEFYDPHHEAVLRTIRLVVENAHRAGKWVGICGELGADTSLTETFLRMGVDELSVSPSMILRLRKKISEIRLDG